MSEFLHHRLDVYHLALELAGSARRIADRVPRGYRGLAEQLLRSGPAVALLVAEGANRFTAPQKRQRFIEARGECGEAAATVEVLQVMGLVSAKELGSFEETASRVGKMLTALVKKHS